MWVSFKAPKHHHARKDLGRSDRSQVGKIGGSALRVTKELEHFDGVSALRLRWEVGKRI